MVGATSTAACNTDCFRVGFDRLLKILEALDRRICRHNEYTSLLSKSRKRGDIFDRDWAFVGYAATNHHRAADHECISHTFALIYKARQTHHARSTAHVFKLEATHKACIAGGLLDRARRTIPAAAWCSGYKHQDAFKQGCCLSKQGQSCCSRDRQRAARLHPLTTAHEVSYTFFGIEKIHGFLRFFCESDYF